MGSLIPVLFVTCPVTRDSTEPVSTPEVRALEGEERAQPRRQEPWGLPHPPFLPSSPATVPDTQSQVHTNCINPLKVQTPSRLTEHVVPSGSH